MRIWVDDIRTPPDDSWTWHKTSYETLMALDKKNKLEEGVDW